MRRHKKFRTACWLVGDALKRLFSADIDRGLDGRLLTVAELLEDAATNIRELCEENVDDFDKPGGQES